MQEGEARRLITEISPDFSCAACLFASLLHFSNVAAMSSLSALKPVFRAWYSETTERGEEGNEAEAINGPSRQA